jgi:hypothetical protein
MPAPDQLSRSDVSEMCLSRPPFHNRFARHTDRAGKSDGGAHEHCGTRPAIGDEQVRARTTFQTRFGVGAGRERSRVIGAIERRCGRSIARIVVGV